MKGTVAHKTKDVASQVTALVEEVIGDSPVFVVDVDVRGSRGSQVVDIFVDSDDELDVDELARISREVGFLLDVEELFPAQYNLNVSSPGLDRPLVLPRQYKKNIGRELRVHYARADGSGNTEVEGEVVGADDEAVEIAASESDVRRIPYDSIVWAKAQLPW